MARSALSSATRSAISASAIGSASTAADSIAAEPAPVQVGIGGWTFEPWRNNFYPAGLPHAKELAYASRRLTAIEINATFYRLMSARSFASWHDETPEGFVFTVKGSRYVTNRRVLGEAGEAIERFMASGIDRLGDKLGAINWQFATTKAFDAGDVGAFLALLPRELAGRRLRHAVEVRHPSFATEAFFDLARARDVAVVFADSDDYPSLTESTADFVYARLMRTEPEIATGYASDRLAQVAESVREWSTQGRDVFAFFISGAKEKAPAAAMALLDRLGMAPSWPLPAVPDKKKPRGSR